MYSGGNYNNYRKPWRGRGSSQNFRGSRRPFGRRPAENNRNYSGNSTNSWKNETVPEKRLTEKDIYVTEYISDHEGFNGIIKMRFSDFQVSEVNEKGEVAELTDLSPPNPPEEEEEMDDEELLLNKYNLEILPMETWDRINKLSLSSGPDYETIEVDVTGMSKEDRTKIHDAVKKAFGDSIIGSTVTRDDKKYCTFDKYRKGVRFDNRVKWIWPAEYLHFILYKENCDTMEAASRIIRGLRMNASVKTAVIGYAGTKDRRAKTSQWVSLRRVDPRKLLSAVAGLPDLAVGNFSFSDVHLKLGMLQGNRFRICLRNVTAEEARAGRCCALLRDNGFVNYYGLQRFGSRAAAPTWLVGLHLLKGNYEEAIKCILEPRPGALSAALAAFRTRGPQAAAALVPRREAGSPEARLLAALAQQPRDLTRALDKVPRNTRLLYLHAYQALVWNRVASLRLRRDPRPVAGDLVPLGDMQEETVETPDDSLIEDGVNEDKEKETEKPVSKNMPQVKILTEEDVESGKYTIFDVVLPLPGHGVVYPPSVVRDYEEILTAAGLTLSMKTKNKAYSVSGGYRRVAARATRVSWRWARYEDPRADLQLSDLDRLNGARATGETPDGKYKALLIDMTLPTSCYATMALRELMRVDTSTETQALQNDHHKTDSVKSDKTDSVKSDECVKSDSVKSDECVKSDSVKSDECLKTDGSFKNDECVKSDESVKTDGSFKNDESVKNGESVNSEIKIDNGEKRKGEESNDVDVKKVKLSNDK